MKANKIATLALLLLITAYTSAQDVRNMVFGPVKGQTYMGQYNFNGKHKNGYGAECYADGSFYVGDFNEDKVTGRGMLISELKGITNVPDAIVYVGNMKNGKKEGKGTCYNELGIMVFNGTFAGDKPQTAEPLTSKIFTVIDAADDAIYLGEVEDGQPKGCGLMLQNDGGITFARYRDGAPRGVGMTLYGKEAWSVGNWTDGGYKEIKNSHDSNQQIQAYQASSKAFIREIRQELFEATMGFAQSGMELATAILQDKNGGAAGGDADGSVPTGQSYDYYNTQYRKWESRAKNCFENRVRKKVTAQTTMDSQVATGEAKNLRSYQRLMRQVRLAAHKSGWKIPISKYENASF